MTETAAEIIANLSNRIVHAQKPIRILDAVKWHPDIKKQFFDSGFRTMPAIDRAYYENSPLNFDLAQKQAEFMEIARDIKRHLGTYSGVAAILSRMCEEYQDVLSMLGARGLPAFSQISQKLYGSSDDVFHVGAPTLNDLAILISETIDAIKIQADNVRDEKIYDSEEAARLLNERLSAYFHDREVGTVVEVSDGIIADAAAGAERIKIRRGAKFSERDLRVLEVHEGWVHLGTTINGLMQPVCTFLSKGTPSATVTQEGLAIIMEIFTFSSHPLRVQRLTDRIKAIHWAEQGANFLEVFHQLREKGLTDEESYTLSYRVFRGSTPTGAPFTKDLAYSKGFILIYNYIRLAIQRGLLSRIPLLFLGKTTLEDLHILEDLMDEGLIQPPHYIPPQFRDMAALSSWMCYSLFLNQLNLKQMAADYKGIL